MKGIPLCTPQKDTNQLPECQQETYKEHGLFYLSDFSGWPSKAVCASVLETVSLLSPHSSSKREKKNKFVTRVTWINIQREESVVL